MQYFLKDRKNIKLRDTHAFFAHNLKRIVLKKKITLDNFTPLSKDCKSKKMEASPRQWQRFDCLMLLSGLM